MNVRRLPHHFNLKLLQIGDKARSIYVWVEKEGVREVLANFSRIRMEVRQSRRRLHNIKFEESGEMLCIAY